MKGKMKGIVKLPFDTKMVVYPDLMYELLFYIYIYIIT